MSTIALAPFLSSQPPLLYGNPHVRHHHRAGLHPQPGTYPPSSNLAEDVEGGDFEEETLEREKIFEKITISWIYIVHYCHLQARLGIHANRSVDHS